MVYRQRHSLRVTNLAQGGTLLQAGEPFGDQCLIGKTETYAVVFYVVFNSV